MIDINYNSWPKENHYEMKFSKSKLYYKSNKLRSLKGSSESDSVSCESISSTSTSYTVNQSKKRGSKDKKVLTHVNNKRLNESYELNLKRDLNIIYEIVCDLYDQEILPTIHEIRRKLSKNGTLLMDPQKLLNLCSKDGRYRTVMLESLSKNSNDIQNGWAVLIKDGPFKNFSNQVDEELLRLVSNYIILISSHRYNKIAILCKGQYRVNKGDESKMKDQDDSEVSEKDVVMVPTDDIFKVGGRYLFAEHLKNNGPSRLSHLPLGKILNIVQKLTEMGLLVYRGNFLVPVVNSKSASNKFILNLKKSYNENCLSKVKQNFASLFSEGTKIALSTIPIAYRDKFGEDLNYPEMGYDKLSEFIKNEIPLCKITKNASQYVACMPKDEMDEGQKQDTITKCEMEKKKVSQTNLSRAYTTVLYPLKITPIK